MNFKNSVLLLGVLLITGCMPRGTLLAEEIYPVQWFSGFTMTQWLMKKVQMYDQEDIRALLNKPWEYSAKLIHLRTQETLSVDRCSQILPDIRQLETYQPSEFPPFAKLATMCVTAESIANALPAQYSFLSDF